MPTITFEGSGYRGRTAAVPWQRPYDPLECRRCGSSLAGRREAVQQITTQGVCQVREIFRCRCGRGRHIDRQEVAAG